MGRRYLSKKGWQESCINLNVIEMESHHSQQTVWLEQRGQLEVPRTAMLNDLKAELLNLHQVIQN
jgi:hypothetical protein